MVQTSRAGGGKCRTYDSRQDAIPRNCRQNGVGPTSKFHCFQFVTPLASPRSNREVTSCSMSSACAPAMVATVPSGAITMASGMTVTPRELSSLISTAQFSVLIHFFFSMTLSAVSEFWTRVLGAGITPKFEQDDGRTGENTNRQKDRKVFAGAVEATEGKHSTSDKQEPSGEV